MGSNSLADVSWRDLFLQYSHSWQSKRDTRSFTQHRNIPNNTTPLQDPRSVRRTRSGVTECKYEMADHKKSPVKTGLSYCFSETHISPSRAKREQGIFYGEGVSVLLVRDRLAGKYNAAIPSAAGIKKAP